MKWTSVDERLPDRPGTYLVALPMYSERFRQYRADVDEVEYVGFGLHVFKIKRVAFWMPLPDPPQPESETP